MGKGREGEGERGEGMEKGKTGESLGEWTGGDGGRADTEAEKKISTLRQPF